MQPQCYIDDSGSDPTHPVFVLAGFIASAEAWAAFSDEWQAALDGEPPLAYFKMKEANRLHGEFSRAKGWAAPTRDDRLVALTRIIKKHALVRVASSLPNEAFYRLVSSLPAPNRTLLTDHPYLFLAAHLMLMVISLADTVGIFEPIDFIFDEQIGFSDEMPRVWAIVKESIEASPRPHLFGKTGSQPIYRDEINFKPLQAADLYAWQVRKNLVQNQGTLWVPPSLTLRQLEEIPSLGSNYNERSLQDMRSFLLQAKDHFAEQNPDTPLIASAGRAMRREAKRSAPKPSSAQRRKKASSEEQPG